MKRQRPDGDSRDGPAGSSFVLPLIDLLADPHSVLYPFLRVPDLFCVRLTCKEAWRRIHHKVLTKKSLWMTALDGTLDKAGEPHIPLLRWCLRQQSIMPLHVANMIGSTGDMPLIEQCIAEYDRRIIVHLASGATRVGDAATAFSLFDRLNDEEFALLDSFEFTQDICAGGSIEVAEYIHDSPTGLSLSADWDPTSLVFALMAGHVPFAHWVLSELALDPGLRKYTIECAAESDSLDLVRWLVDEHSCPISVAVLRSAAQHGRLDTLKWLDGQEGGGDLQQVMASATHGGQIHVVEWLMEQGCVLTEDAIYEAAAGSTTATVAWLMDHGCPFVEETLVKRSCRHTSGDIFQFLVETKHMRYNPQDCRYEAMRNSWFADTVLRNVADVPWNSDYMQRCIPLGDLHGFRFALEQKAPLDWHPILFMIIEEEYAMLYETLDHCLFQGKLTDECRDLIEKALRHVGALPSLEVVQVLAHFGYQVREGNWMRLEDVKDSNFLLPRLRGRAKIAGRP